MPESGLIAVLKTTAPLLGGIFAGLGAYLGVLAANQRGLRTIEALLFASNMVRVQATGLQKAAPRQAQDYEVASALDTRNRVVNLLRHVNVTDLPNDIPIKILPMIEALANSQDVMVNRALTGKATEPEMTTFLSNTVSALDAETPFLVSERKHLRRWVGIRWAYPTPWRKQSGDKP